MRALALIPSSSAVAADQLTVCAASAWATPKALAVEIGLRHARLLEREFGRPGDVFVDGQPASPALRRVYGVLP